MKKKASEWWHSLLFDDCCHLYVREGTKQDLSFLLVVNFVLLIIITLNWLSTLNFALSFQIDITMAAEPGTPPFHECVTSPHDEVSATSLAVLGTPAFDLKQWHMLREMGWANWRPAAGRMARGHLWPHIYHHIDKFKSFHPGRTVNHTHHGGIFNFDFSTDGWLSTEI